ncbi:MAG: DUF1194 domain-containing protein [Amaricoccus sp.]
MLRALVIVAVSAVPAAAQPALEPVDLELVLLADASGSIDATENRLQRQGYADALADPSVLWAIRHGGERGRIAVAYVEWAGRREQDVVVDWTVIDGEASARAFGARLLAAPRQVTGTNAIGAALFKGLELIGNNGFDGAREVIDLSGDSIWNPRPPTIASARDAALGQGVTINGLAVLCDDCSGRPGVGDLETDFRDHLIVGDDAFVVTADGDAAFANAVRRKLILEVSGRVPPGPPDVRSAQVFTDDRKMECHLPTE